MTISTPSIKINGMQPKVDVKYIPISAEQFWRHLPDVGTQLGHNELEKNTCLPTKPPTANKNMQSSVKQHLKKPKHNEKAWKVILFYGICT